MVARFLPERCCDRRAAPSRSCLSAAQIREDPARERFGKAWHACDVLSRGLFDPAQGAKPAEQDLLPLWSDARDVTEIRPEGSFATKLSVVTDSEAVRLVTGTLQEV